MKFDRARVEYLSHEAIGSAIEVHRRLGPGLLEEVYVRALLIELQHRNIAASDSQRIPLYYRGVQIGSPYVLDILVDGLVVVEVKAVAMLAAVHTAQPAADTLSRESDIPVEPNDLAQFHS